MCSHCMAHTNPFPEVKGDSVFNDIVAELNRQNKKWGESRTLDPRTWITVLMEEVGEVAHASLEHDRSNYREELVQVAAVCISAIKSLDSETPGGDA